MPSPFHQKYATQAHAFKASPTTPDSPAKDADASPTSADSRRGSTTTTRFQALEALKRPQTKDHLDRRASLHDARIGQSGLLGSWWDSFTRGYSTTFTSSHKKDEFPPQK